MMKTSVKRLVSLMLALLLLVGAALPAANMASAAEDGITVRINALKTKFPQGKFWNHYVSKASEAGLSSSKNESFANSVTTHPCATHSANAKVGQYECNYFDGGVQCWGFACKFFYDIFGVRASKMFKRTDTANIQPGDYLRFGTDADGHSAVCIARSGNTLTLVEGNFHPTYSVKENCYINWNRTVALSKVSYFKRASNYDTVKNTQATFYLDVNLTVDGAAYNSGHDSTTFDVYLNGKLVKDNVKDYNVASVKGTKYEIKDIRISGCYARANNNALSGTLNADTKLVIPIVTSHTPVALPAAAATCTKSGLTAGEKCSVCGTVLTAQKTVPALDHNLTETVIPATCAQLRRIRYDCTRCDQTETKVDPALFTEWSELSAPENALASETRTQYRYAVREAEWKQTQTGTVEYAVSWPAGFNKSNSLYTKYNKTPVTAYENDAEKVAVTTETIGYVYWHWCYGTYTAGPINRKISDEKTSTYPTFHAFYSTKDVAVTSSANARKIENKSVCTDTYWWVTARVEIKRCAYVKYRRVNTDGWSKWSEWQDTPVRETPLTKTETRTLSRWVVPADGLYAPHTWGAWTAGDAKDQQKRVCSVCGKTETRTIKTELAPVTNLLFGDVDRNGKVSAADARLALRRAVMLENYAKDTVQYLVSDVNFDDKITAADARLILRAAVSLEDPAKWLQTYEKMQKA